METLSPSRPNDCVSSKPQIIGTDSTPRNNWRFPLPMTAAPAELRTLGPLGLEPPRLPQLPPGLGAVGVSEEEAVAYLKIQEKETKRNLKETLLGA